MSENTLVNDMVTDTSEDTGNQAQTAKSYNQQEVDNMMARMRGSLEKKFSKTFEELGDIDELRQLKTEAEKRRQEAQLKRGEFEKTLQEQAAKFGQEIQKRDTIIQDYKLNMPLLNAAAKFKAVNPEQVQTLLRNSVRLNEEGEAEVIDSTGAVRYTDSGSPVTVEQYVEEWLRGNPHFVAAAPSTVNTKTSIKPGSNGKIDLKDLDLTRPQDRQIYAEARAKGLI
jgi:hypothetical protein